MDIPGAIASRRNRDILKLNADLPELLRRVSVKTQLVPEDAGALAVVEDVSDFAFSAAPDAAGDDSDLDPVSDCFSSVFLLAPVAPLPPLKSVTYQPPPLSWKPAAVTILLSVDFLHSGQSVN